MLRLFFFGPFEATLNDRPIEGFESDAARALLAYLALEPRRPHSRAALTTWLYPELPPDKADQNFRKTLSRLRKVLDALPARVPFLLAEGRNLQWNTDGAYWLDADTFCEHVRAATGTNWQPVQQWEQAARLAGRGRFLEDVVVPSYDFEEWVSARHEYYRQQFLQVLHELAGHAGRIGDYERMLDYARRQLRLEGWWEEAHQQAMQALWGLGRRSAALAQYESCRQALATQLNIAPLPATEELRRQIAEAPASAGPDLPNNLPQLQTTLWGRQEERQAVLSYLVAPGPGTRLVTLTGEGGIGKTSLALAVAHQLAGAAVASPFPDGVWFVPLAEIPAQEDAAALEAHLAGVMMQAMGLQPATHLPVRQQLSDYLQDKRLLLVLDNWEHLPAGLGLVRELLGRSAGLSVLATSRRALQLRGEQVIAVSGLPVPATLEPSPSSVPATTGAALQLFADSARRNDHRFSLAPDVLADAWRIIRFVQGNPLGIELAAAWVDRLAPAAIAASLEQAGLELLATPLRDVPERQRSMRAVMDYPWQLLSAAERTVLALAAVFQSSFSAALLEDALKELPDSVSVAGRVEDMLSNLATHSLLAYQPESGRYYMHELLRQFGREMLAQNSVEWPVAPGATALALAQTGHSRAVLAWLSGQEAVLYGRDALPAVNEINSLSEDVQAAWKWAAERGDAVALSSSLAALVRYCQIVGRQQEAIGLLDMAATGLLTRFDNQATRLRAHLLGWQGNFLNGFGQHEAALACGLEAAELGRQTGEAAAQCHGELVQVRVYQSLSRDREGRAHMQRAVELAEAHGLVAWQVICLAATSPWFTPLASVEPALALVEQLGDSYLRLMLLIRIGGGASGAGNLWRAREAWEEALLFARRFGNRSLEVTLLNNLGDINRHLWQLEQARANHEEALALSRHLGRQDHQGHILEGLARVYYRLGLAEEAVEAIEAGLSLPYVEANWMRIPYWNTLGRVRLSRGDLAGAREALEQAAVTGRQLSSSLALKESYAGLAAVAMAGEQPGLALEYVAYIQTYLRQEELAGYFDPVWILLTCYEVLQAMGQPSAEAILAQAVGWLERQAAYLPAEAQRVFLEEIPEHAATIRAWESAGSRVNA